MNKKIKTAITVLSVLLAISLLLLVGMYVVRYYSERRNASVVVPENIVTEDDKDQTTHSDGEKKPDNTGTDSSGTGDQDPNTDPPPGENDDPSPTPSSGKPEEKPKEASALVLHTRHSGDNEAFAVGNMFPGDRETQYFCVRVFHKGDVTLRVRANIRDGYEKLAEALHCRISLVEDGRVLYDGQMQDMPQSVNVALKTTQSTTSEVYFEITAYLDTSAGNEYAGQTLVADFSWWVNETDQLDPPDTGDAFAPILWVFVAAGALLVLLLLVRKQKKGDDTDEE